MKLLYKTLLLFFVVLILGCSTSTEVRQNIETINFMQERIENSLKDIPEVGFFPRSMDRDKPSYVGVYDWTSGFYPGTLWYLYELTGDHKWKKEAERLTQYLEQLQYYKNDHDIGFQLNCSYGNGFRLTKHDTYKQVILNGAESLITRYDSITKCIKSWDWKGKTKDGVPFNYPVIIDNMMNLELLYCASNLSGNMRYREVAVAHTKTTMKHHFRPDKSSYHLVNYDSITGEVLGKYTFQGYSNESSWARGQAWALYGFTLSAKETGYKEFLNHAEGIAHYIINHPSIPNDKVPKWDYHIGEADFVPSWSSILPKKLDYRDASSAAVTCTAMYDLGKITGKKKYINYANELLSTLNTRYRSKNDFFLLGHSVGNFPKKEEIDVSLNYADYYFIESFVKSTKINVSNDGTLN